MNIFHNIITSRKSAGPRNDVFHQTDILIVVYIIIIMKHRFFFHQTSINSNTLNYFVYISQQI